MSQETPQQVQSNELRMILVGKTGAGKSATGNTILGCKKFSVNPSGRSTAIGAVYERIHRFEKNLLVIDTPGLFDTHTTNDDIAGEISNFLLVSAPGPHAIIFVTSADSRFTREEVGCITRMKAIFGEDLVKHLIIVITRTENWEEDEMTPEQFLADLPEEAKAALGYKRESSKVLPFQNTLKEKASEPQVKELLKKVAEMVEANGGTYYSERKWNEAEKLMQQRMKEIIDSDMSAEKDRQAALEREVRAEMEQMLNQKRPEMKRNQAMGSSPSSEQRNQGPPRRPLPVPQQMRTESSYHAEACTASGLQDMPVLDTRCEQYRGNALAAKQNLKAAVGEELFSHAELIVQKFEHDIGQLQAANMKLGEDNRKMRKMMENSIESLKRQMNQDLQDNARQRARKEAGTGLLGRIVSAIETFFH